MSDKDKDETLTEKFPKNTTKGDEYSQLTSYLIQAHTLANRLFYPKAAEAIEKAMANLETPSESFARDPETFGKVAQKLIDSGSKIK